MMLCVCVVAVNIVETQERQADRLDDIAHDDDDYADAETMMQKLNDETADMHDDNDDQDDDGNVSDEVKKFNGECDDPAAMQQSADDDDDEMICAELSKSHETPSAAVCVPANSDAADDEHDSTDTQGNRTLVMCFSLFSI